MSAFDDEFGLFGESGDEAERRPTLGARKIVSSETVIDEFEPEDDQPRRPARQERPTRQDRPPRREYGRRRQGSDQPSADPWAGHRRATGLLSFVARKLVAEGERVNVELFVDEQAQPVIELVVAPDDLGKVIGRNGRVAHALRTLVRATAEGRVSIDILDTEEAAEPLDEDADG